MAMTANAAEGGPMMEINTTPLIDVMLVLLIMFIITIPLQTHAVKVDVPQTQAPPPHDLPDPVKNKVVVTQSGAVLWNGAPIDLVRLRQYLDMTQRMDPVPELHLQPDAQAPYVVVDKVLAVTKRAQVTKMGFVGNEDYATAF